MPERAPGTVGAAARKMPTFEWNRQSVRGATRPYRHTLAGWELEPGERIVRRRLVNFEVVCPVMDHLLLNATAALAVAGTSNGGMPRNAMGRAAAGVRMKARTLGITPKRAKR